MPRRTYKLSRCSACAQPRRLTRSGRCRACAHRAYSALASREPEPDPARVYDELARELVQRGLVSTAVLGPIGGPRPQGEGAPESLSPDRADNPAASFSSLPGPKPPLREMP